ncbi:hypothetical protein [Bifidobacterium sp. ESL0704]|uniref:hypothetical protein n=1 Tax=Bifidobacterium sp. ESL0704 TaxID=2983219 RepID=UPI0023F94272|nr:hypothetical protein [Bifidobacterium sp. ESL0704]WEV53103.1 hypothetical protein OZX64_00960 [Bifidobacterium sp. ESL0704]
MAESTASNSDKRRSTGKRRLVGQCRPENTEVPNRPGHVRSASRPPAFPLQLAVLQEERRCEMQCDDLFEMDGVRLGYTEDTVTITEVDYGRKAVFDNKGNVLSSNFPDDFMPFLLNYYKLNYDLVQGSREDDREFGDD